MKGTPNPYKVGGPAHFTRRPELDSTLTGQAVGWHVWTYDPTGAKRICPPDETFEPFTVTICPECNGSGDCPNCEGDGTYPVVNNSGETDAEDCDNCGGYGACPMCEGAGEAPMPVKRLSGEEETEQKTSSAF